MNDGREFEDLVRRIARARWPQAEYGGAVLIDGRERDGVFATEDNIHFVEATVSKGLDKAKEDAKKLFDLVTKAQKANPMKGARGWFITKHEPTADQRTAVEQIGKHQITACSIETFQRSLVDVQGYLSARENHFFGSVVDPATQSISPQVDYVPLDIVDKTDGTLLNIRQLADHLVAGGTFVLQGDYGAGKSMTLRQVFFTLKDMYGRGGSAKFPLYINLREHSGQDDPAELIERHARRIGFASPASLVRAWRAGFCCVLLDGYDEITTLGASQRLLLKSIRRESLTAVRRLIEQSPHGTGWVVAGREHFFDSDAERRGALGYPATTRVLTLNEFSDDQIQQYLTRLGSTNLGVLPHWLPTRPLFVGYMAARGLFNELISADLLADPIDGWEYLISRICEREARIATNLDGPTLRAVLERLATVARASNDGLGPVSQAQIREAFIDVCGYEPDDKANLLLQRMPGLGVHRVEEDTRSFVDLELAEICRAGDFVQFIEQPYSKLQDSGWRRAVSEMTTFIGDLAVQKAERDIHERKLGQGHLDGASQALDSTTEFEVLKADLIALFQRCGFEPVQEISIVGVFFDNAQFEYSPDDRLSRVTYKEWFFDSIELDPEAASTGIPKFRGCVVTSLKGRSSEQDLPAGRFSGDCVIENFSKAASTQSAILSTDLSKGQKIVLTLLRKLFVQSLGGRQEGALCRGLDLNDRAKVPAVLHLLQQQGVAAPSNRASDGVWIPNRKMLHRVRQILAAPTNSQDALMLEAKALFS